MCPRPGTSHAKNAASQGSFRSISVTTPSMSDNVLAIQRLDILWRTLHVMRSWCGPTILGRRASSSRPVSGHLRHRFIMQGHWPRGTIELCRTALPVAAHVFRMATRDIAVDKTKLAVFDTFEDAERQDRAYWLSKTPIERLAACERLRQITYGYDPATARLPRSFEVLERGAG